MAGAVDVLLNKADEGVEKVREHYESDLAAQEVSDELLYDVRQVIGDVQSALDMTANAVSVKFGRKGGRSPYFPLYDDPRKVEAALDTQIKGLRAKHPEIAAAFERHQPYQPGKSELGYLHQLGRVNKHQDFTAQTRYERRATRWEHPSATIETDNRGNVMIGPPAGSTNTIINGPLEPVTPTVTVYVDWLFVDPPVSVLGTLEALGRLTRSAVEDIDSEAGL